MDQSTLLLVAVLACPIGMGAAMWLMMRQSGRQQMPRDATKAQRTAPRIAALQARREALAKEIRELEQAQPLQAQSDQLQRQIAPVREEPQA